MATQGISTKPESADKTRGIGNIVTGETLENNKVALHVLDKSIVSQIGTDVVDNIAANVITAASHAALKGDVIRMTSGAASGSEYRVFEVTTNTITLENDKLTTAPVATDTFEILRPTSLTVSSTGEITAAVTLDPIEYNLDTGAGAVATTVLEDTGTPADSRPLPVRLFNSVGDQLGTATDPVRTDTTGTTTQPVSASSLPLPTGASTSALQTSSEALLTTIDADTSTLAGTVAGSEQQVDIVAALPTGVNSIGAVTQATHDNFNANANIQVGDADNSATNPVFTDRLTVVDVLDTPLLDATTINGSGGALVDVVASLASATKKVQLFSTAGRFIGLYDDTVLVAQFGPGSDDTVEVSIAASSVIALRSLETAAPAGGSIVVNFLG